MPSFLDILQILQRQHLPNAADDNKRASDCCTHNNCRLIPLQAVVFNKGVPNQRVLAIVEVGDILHRIAHWRYVKDPLQKFWGRDFCQRETIEETCKNLEGHQYIVCLLGIRGYCSAETNHGIHHKKVQDSPIQKIAEGTPWHLAHSKHDYDQQQESDQRQGHVHNQECGNVSSFTVQFLRRL